MASTNYNKMCTSCGGNKWEYDRELKVWLCRYCGAQVEWREEYDGLYTIKNVVRQVILDAAYRRMEQADRNLSECQKINARYAGTLVASICYRMISAVSGLCPSGQDPRSMLEQTRRDYQQLTREDKNMSDDETALYEFLDSDDAWAVLAMVFDTLGDQQRREFLLTLFNPQQVFSKETNKSLLRFSLKNRRLDLAEKVLSHPEHVDRTDALKTILVNCPDGPEKARMGALLLQKGAFKKGEEGFLEQYLAKSADAGATKNAIATAAMKSGLAIKPDALVSNVLPDADAGVMQSTLSSLFSRKLYDAEIEQLLHFAASQTDAGRSGAVLDAIIKSGQFVSLSVKQAQEFLFNTQLPANQRIALLGQLRNFTASDRMWEIVAGAYLCQVEEAPESRALLLDALCQNLTSIPARDFEQYVLQISWDGPLKGERIANLLALSGMNTGFFRELAGKYLQNAQDDPELRNIVLHQLLNCGLSIDGTKLVEYICYGKDTAETKTELAQLALKNGTAMHADAISTYLERCTDTFNTQLFSLLYTPGSSISVKALENYVLRCPDHPAVKVQNAGTLASHMGIGLGNTPSTIRHLGATVSCNLAQAYILSTQDEGVIATQMLQSMLQAGAKLTAPVQVNHATKKFHKYVQEVKDQLSPVSLQLCQEQRLFSRFF